MDKQLHIWMKNYYPKDTVFDYCSTGHSVDFGHKIIHTTQTHFCNTKMFEYGYRIFVHMLNDRCVEIKLGKNDCTDREIRMEHNLEKLLLSNEFGMAKDADHI